MGRRLPRRRFLSQSIGLAAVALLLGLLAACGGGQHSPIPRGIAGGDTAAGKSAMQRYGCGACHAIPGVPGANAYVGPPLDKFSQRSFVAGVLANTPPNLEHWIQDPQSVVPGNGMPNMGVTDEDARNIAAYLYSLK